MQASLDVDYGADEIGFTWAGFDDMTEVSGAGSAPRSPRPSFRP
jgi:hypothetical protein